MKFNKSKPILSFESELEAKWRSQFQSPKPFVEALVPPAQQPSRDHLRLDLRGALEDIENACIAEDAGDRVFGRVPVAAVDLERVVGVGPGGARGQELRHAGLDVAAAVAVLLARREVRELTRDHGLDRHPRELAADAG